jgi:NAD(P)-dependent dehydrogenase (short-subunit alcohol dehydrogenase family)
MTKTSKPLSELISLEGRKALITGCAVGLGRAMAHRFAESSADSDLVDKNIEHLNVVAEELSRFESEIRPHKTDLSVCMPTRPVFTSFIGEYGGCWTDCSTQHIGLGQPWGIDSVVGVLTEGSLGDMMA